MSGDAVRAVVLASGGLDSTTVMAMARAQGLSVYALSFAYGQRQRRVELAAAKRIATAMGCAEHRIEQLDLGAVGGSALTADIEVPKGRSPEARAQQIPVTYVPARNTVFLAHALAWAEVLGAYDLFIGVNAVDYSGYPDCRGAFVAAFEQLANVATAAAVQGRGRFRVHAPLLSMTKADIIRQGLRLGVDYGWTRSCYDPIDDLACGSCDACTLRRDGFREAGVPDPTRYVSNRDMS